MDSRSPATGARKPQAQNVSSGNVGSSKGSEGSTNEGRNKNRNRNRNRRRNKNRDNKNEKKSQPAMGEQEGENEKLQVKNRRRRNNNETSKKNILKFPREMNDDGSKRTAARRQEEIHQCIHVLSDFKLFKKGRHVNSFGYRISFTTNSGKFSQQVLFNIPLEYPKAAIKLTMRNNENVSTDMELVIANFNWKARQLAKEKWEILSQINYLASEFEVLKQANYKQIDKLRNIFYNTV
ncbi:YIL161W [Saccharomyces arboricola H-6]|uniref:YIL161W n=1 Tax=Saccharomyces arboricola (strain H-6 / AS 2.3317 / CBS 10644) TaxID=1160507 RepID=J8Q122_SACAR|nr:YIL161W [Saccharomyces arboricola H-6]